MRIASKINPDNPWLNVIKFATVEQRGYRLGMRNPKTLPDSSTNTETEYQNECGSRHWQTVRKLAAAGRYIGAKYV